MKKFRSVLTGALLTILAGVSLFGLAACGGTQTLPDGTYNGVPTGAGVMTGSFTGNVYNLGISDEPSPTAVLTVGANNVIGITIGVGSFYFINTNAVGQEATEWKYVLSNNQITVQQKLPNGGAWEDWNGSAQATINTNILKTLTGTFNETTGVITIVCTATQGGDSISRTFEFTQA